MLSVTLKRGTDLLHEMGELCNVSSQQVRHADSGVLYKSKRERQTAKAIFKATTGAISTVPGMLIYPVSRLSSAMALYSPFKHLLLDL